MLVQGVAHGGREARRGGVARLAWTSAALPALAVGLVALAAYLPTLAPTITWRNGGADSGELAAVVATLGIPHPPGYPTYVLLGHAWALLPLGGDIAYRLNLLSAVGASLAAALCAAIIGRLGPGLGLHGRALAAGAALGGLGLALSPLTWSQATVAEVYAPGLAALGLFSLLALGWRAGVRRRELAVAGLVGGLGLGMLPQLTLAAPGALGLLARAGRRGLVWRLASLAGGAAAGLAIFAYLPLRAAQQPQLAWGDATTLPGFWTLVTAAQYRQFLGTADAATWSARLLESLGLLGGELGVIGAGLAALGVARLRRERAALGYLLGLAGLAVLFRASYTAEGNVVYLLPAVFALAVVLGVGAARLLALARASWGPAAAGLVALGLFVLLAARAASVAPAVDASADRAAELFGHRVLAALPADAVLVSERDETTFSLWYRQALGERADVMVVDGRLLFYGWYRADLARHHPDLDAAALRPGGLTALQRPLYVLAGPPGEEVVRRVR